MPVMKITAAPVSFFIGNQLAACANADTNEVFLIVPITTAQTRSLRTMFIRCQRGVDHQSLVIPSTGSEPAAVSPGETVSGGADSSLGSAAVAFSSSAFKRFSATYSLADLCSDSAFSLLIP